MEKAEALRKKKLAAEEEKATKEAERLKQLEEEKEKKRKEAAEAAAKAKVLEEQAAAQAAALEESRAQSRGNSSRSSSSDQDILERLLRTFVHTAAGTLRCLADDQEKSQAAKGGNAGSKPQVPVRTVPTKLPEAPHLPQHPAGPLHNGYTVHASMQQHQQQLVSHPAQHQSGHHCGSH